MATVLAALISAVGTLCGALGAIALTSSLEARRQARAAALAVAEQREAAAEQASTDLLAVIARLRGGVELACARHWRDMNVRLSAIAEHADATGTLAARVALLGGPEAETAMALSRCASALATWAAKAAALGDFDGPNRQFVAGQIAQRPDLSELDRLTMDFMRLRLSARLPGQPGRV